MSNKKIKLKDLPKDEIVQMLVEENEKRREVEDKIRILEKSSNYFREECEKLERIHHQMLIDNNK